MDDEVPAEGLAPPPEYLEAPPLRVVRPVDPGPVARELVSLTITVDSVVATATIVVDDSHRQVTVLWGDGTADRIDTSRLRRLSPRTHDDRPPNTLRVQHVYESPREGSQLVNVISRDDEGLSVTQTVLIEIEPRYRVQLFSVLLESPTTSTRSSRRRPRSRRACTPATRGCASSTAGGRPMSSPPRTSPPGRRSGWSWTAAASCAS